MPTLLFSKFDRATFYKLTLIPFSCASLYRKITSLITTWYVIKIVYVLKGGKNICFLVIVIINTFTLQSGILTLEEDGTLKIYYED